MGAALRVSCDSFLFGDLVSLSRVSSRKKKLLSPFTANKRRKAHLQQINAVGF